jgi:hypothetical protein
MAEGHTPESKGLYEDEISDRKEGSRDEPFYQNHL